MINRINTQFVSEHLNNAIYRTRGRLGQNFLITWLVMGILLMVAAIVIGALLVKYYGKFIKVTDKKIVANYDAQMQTLGYGLACTAVISGPVLGAACGGISYGIACRLLDRKIAACRAFVETLPRNNNEALDESQLRRFFDMSSLKGRFEIWERCQTQTELKVYIEKFGKEHAYEAFDIIRFIDNPNQPYDIPSLNTPKRNHLFYAYAKTKPLHHRLQIAVKLFENSAFNEKDPEVIEFHDFKPSPQTLALDLGRWGKASSFLSPHIEKNLIKVEPKSIKEKLQIVFDNVLVQSETMHKLLAAMFEGKRIQPHEEQSILNCAKQYLEGFYDQTLAPFLTEKESEMHHRKREG